MVSVCHSGRYICSPGGACLSTWYRCSNKKKMRKGTFFKLDGAKHCHRLGSEKWHFSGKRVGLLKSD